MKLKKTIPLFLRTLLLGCSLTVPALSDCCGPPPSAPSDFQQGPGWTATVVYEHMDMKTLRRGSQEVSADQVINERLDAGATSFSVPTRMFMDRTSLQLRYKFDDHHALRVSVPWRSNEMDMSMGSKGGGLNSAHGHDHGRMHSTDMGGHAGSHASDPLSLPTNYMNHTMDPVTGLGDVTLNYNYIFALDNSQAWVGAGVQLPTGEWNARGSNGQLIHNMMQPGSGALGLLAEMGADIPLGTESKLSFHPRLGFQWNGSNSLGYQRGTRLDYELGTRYQVASKVGLSLDLTGFRMGQDSTNGTIDRSTGEVAFQRPTVSLADDVNNTGGHYLFLAPGIRIDPSDSILLGFQYRVPLTQKVKGTQLGIDSWYRLFASARF